MSTKTFYAEDICCKTTTLGSFTNGKYRLVELRTKDPAIQHKNVVVQFCRGGEVNNSFGVTTNQYGKTLLTFSVGDYEAQRFRKWEDHIIKCVVDRKDELWAGKSITQTQIQDNFARLIGEKRPMKDGNGFWPGTGKITVPLNKDTGKVNAIIQDQEGNPVELYDTMGRKWSKILVVMEAIYFNGKFVAGFGPKTLHTLVVDNEEKDQVINVLPDPPPLEDPMKPKAKKRKVEQTKKV